MTDETTAAGPPLLSFLAHVPDHRRANRHHPLPAILALSTCAMLCGARSLYAIAQWGRDHGPLIARALGFADGKTPCVATLHYVFKELDVAAFEAALSAWTGRAGRPDAIAVDGKTLRGSQGHQLPGVHLLSAFSHALGLVLAQQEVGSKGGELMGARQMLRALDLHGVVVTGDALFAQRDLCAQIVAKGGTTC